MNLIRRQELKRYKNFGKKVKIVFVFSLFVLGFVTFLISTTSENLDQKQIQLDNSNGKNPNKNEALSNDIERSFPIKDQELELSKKIYVLNVIDGDTIKLSDGKVVRYIGINTPETKDKRKGIECYGKEAFEKNKELVEGKEIRLEKDVSEKDKYGRLLRYVYVDDIFVNDYLVREGYAYAVTYPPDVKYQKQFKEAQEEARENNRGLWKECKL